MKCYKCEAGIETGKSFIPIEPPGTPKRKWICTKCATIAQKRKAEGSLGKEGLEITRMFEPDFLRDMQIKKRGK